MANTTTTRLLNGLVILGSIPRCCNPQLLHPMASEADILPLQSPQSNQSSKAPTNTHACD